MSFVCAVQVFSLGGLTNLHAHKDGIQQNDAADALTRPRQWTHTHGTHDSPPPLTHSFADSLTRLKRVVCTKGTSTASKHNGMCVVALPSPPTISDSPLSDSLDLSESA